MDRHPDSGRGLWSGLMQGEARRPGCWWVLGAPAGVPWVAGGRLPEWVRARYATECAWTGLVAWRTASEAGLVLGSSCAVWSVERYPRGIITPWHSQGGERAELCACRALPAELVALRLDRCDGTNLGWPSSRRSILAQLFPGGLELGGHIVYGELAAMPATGGWCCRTTGWS
jgi:hypothetical protein